MIDDRNMAAAIAVTRFGLGARPGEIAEVARDPQAWLRAQIRRGGADQPLTDGETSTIRLAAFRDYQQERRLARSEPQAPSPGAAKMARRDLRDDTAEDFLARVRLGVATEAGFRERWTLFWANHFTVSATKLATAAVVGPFETEALRPHVFGRFADLLAAVETHPAMLLYLDQAQSVGPNSRAAQGAARRGNAAAGRRSGLNENLAREILELHTVGRDGGYDQADVTEFARALTGLSVAGAAAEDGVVFRAAAHEPGERTMMGLRYPAGGQEQARAILADLAEKPATARFVCTKIARHFVADRPPPTLVARLEQAWTSSRGDLAEVADALIAAPEAWDPSPVKFKTPYEYLVSSYRAAGGAPERTRQVAPLLTSLGQKPYSPPSPAGWPEEAESWATADAVIKRMQFAQGFSTTAVQGRDPKLLAREALGARLAPATATAVARAESRPEGFALMLMSPEFQRR